MSSYQDYASRRPQEPWKYLDIYFAPPLVCSAIQCIIFCGWETRFQVAKRQNLKRLVFGFFFFLHCATAFQPLSRSKLRPHPDTTDSSSLILHLHSVAYHCSNIDSSTVVHNSMTCFEAGRNGRRSSPEQVLNVVKLHLETWESLFAFALTWTHRLCTDRQLTEAHWGVIKSFIWIIFQLLRGAGLGLKLTAGQSLRLHFKHPLYYL